MRQNSIAVKRDWGLIVTYLAIASVFAGSTLIKLDVAFFSLYPLRFFGFLGFFIVLAANKNWTDPLLKSFYNFNIFFLILGLVSTLWAPDTITGIKEFGILQTGVTLTLMIILFIDTEDKVEVLFKIWMVGAIFVNLIGLYEVIFQKYLIVVDLGGKTERLAMRVGFLAPRSIFINQNNYAFFNSLTALMLFGNLIKPPKSFIWFMINCFSLLIGLYVLISSYSRAAIGSFSFGLGLFIVFTFFSSNTYKSNLYKLVGVLLLAFIGALIFNESLLDSLINKISLVVKKNEVSSDGEARGVIYTMCLNYAMDNLGFGMGPGSSVLPSVGMPPHNFFLQILIEYGIIMVIGILLFLYKCFRRISVYHKVVSNALPAIIKASILVFPLLSVGPSSIMGEGIFWLWFGFIIAYSSVIYRKGQELLLEITEKADTSYKLSNQITSPTLPLKVK